MTAISEDPPRWRNRDLSKYAAAGAFTGMLSAAIVGFLAHLFIANASHEAAIESGAQGASNAYVQAICDFAHECEFYVRAHTYDYDRRHDLYPREEVNTQYKLFHIRRGEVFERVGALVKVSRLPNGCTGYDSYRAGLGFANHEPSQAECFYKFPDDPEFLTWSKLFSF